MLASICMQRSAVHPVSAACTRACARKMFLGAQRRRHQNSKAHAPGHITMARMHARTSAHRHCCSYLRRQCLRCKVPQCGRGRQMRRGAVNRTATLRSRAPLLGRAVVPDDPHAATLGTRHRQTLHPYCPGLASYCWRCRGRGCAFANGHLCCARARRLRRETRSSSRRKLRRVGMAASHQPEGKHLAGVRQRSREVTPVQRPRRSPAAFLRGLPRSCTRVQVNI